MVSLTYSFIAKRRRDGENVEMHQALEWKKIPLTLNQTANKFTQSIHGEKRVYKLFFVCVLAIGY